MLFSIIIPVYNAETYLDTCIRSVLNQDFENFEIILVNDCSTDKSGHICDSFSKQHQQIKVIHQKNNCGVSFSRNIGIKASSGEYIIFLDSDDFLLGQCFNGLAKLIGEKPGTDLIIGNFTCQPEKISLTNQKLEESHGADNVIDSEIINYGSHDEILKHIKNFSIYLGFCWRYIIKRRFILQNNIYFIPAQIYEDQAYVTRLFCLSRTFAYYETCFYCYRVRVNNFCNKMDLQASIACLEVINDMCDLIKNYDLSSLKVDFINSKLKTPLELLIPRLLTHNREEILQLSKIIDRYIDNFQVIQKISRKFDLYFFIKTFGVFHGLILYKIWLKEKTISLINKQKLIYVFCKNIFGEGLAYLLQKENYHVLGFLDNNKELQGKKYLGLEVSSPNILDSKTKDELSNILVLICSHQKKVFRNISKQLEQKGLSIKQLVSLHDVTNF